MSWISPFTVATIIFPFDTVLVLFFAKLSFIVFKETFTVSADCINWGKNISPLSYGINNLILYWFGYKISSIRLINSL